MDENFVSFEEKTVSNEDVKRELDILRRKQNDILLRVLEEERQAEEQRISALRSTTDVESRKNLEMIFAEERKRASERIIRQTKDNEAIIKQAIISSALQQ